jgi:hypothetical protein
MALKALEIGHLRAVGFIGPKVLDAFSDGYGAGFRAGQKEFIKHVLNHGMLLPPAGIQNRGNRGGERGTKGLNQGVLPTPLGSVFRGSR